MSSFNSEFAGIVHANEPEVVAAVTEYLGPTVIEFPGGQVAEEVNEPVPPWQIVTPVVGGDGITATKTVSVLEQPLVVPVTVYVVSTLGAAVTVVPVVRGVKPVAGDQVYVDAPLAVNEVPMLVQINADAGVIEIVGKAFTIISMSLVFLHPLIAVPVTVYVVVVIGSAVITAPAVADKPVLGVQLYVNAPVAVIVVLPPIQTEAGLAETFTVGNGFTETYTVFVAVHPAGSV